VRILVIEDDVRIADVVRRTLVEAGYAVDTRHTAPDGIEAFQVDSYDLVLLDILLPGIPDGGFGVCRAIRAANTDVPIMMLTALDTVKNKVLGLDVGADDYLVKPVHVAELLARVRALLRRSPSGHPPSLRVGDLELDAATRTASRAGRSIPLTAKEYAVLDYLMRNAETIVSSSALIDHAWDTNYDGVSNVVQTYIRYVRKKLTAGGEPDMIETLRGSGYRLVPRP